RLVEQHRHMTAVQGVSRWRLEAQHAIRLHLRRQVEALFELHRVEVEYRQEVFAYLCRWCHTSSTTVTEKNPCPRWFLCSVLGIDPHVIRAEIARPYSGCRRAGTQVD